MVRLLKFLNSTWVTLVPKCPNPSSTFNFRLIFCCNVLYKCITKIFFTRLQSCLPHLIRKNQSAFVEGRRIDDNILLAQEVVQNYQKFDRHRKCTIKIYITKAFDTVNWTFLEHVLHAFSSPATFIHWIIECVNSLSCFILINGKPNRFFKDKKCLRQGDPLSPYLFIMCMEVLSKLIDNAARDGVFGYHPKCKALALTHLVFADDLVFFFFWVF